MHPRNVQPRAELTTRERIETRRKIGKEFPEHPRVNADDPDAVYADDPQAGPPEAPGPSKPLTDKQLEAISGPARNDNERRLRCDICLKPVDNLSTKDSRAVSPLSFWMALHAW